MLNTLWDLRLCTVQIHVVLVKFFLGTDNTWLGEKKLKTDSISNADIS